jgi:hypothetical protein
MLKFGIRFGITVGGQGFPARFPSEPGRLNGTNLTDERQIESDDDDRVCLRRV